MATYKLLSNEYATSTIRSLSEEYEAPNLKAAMIRDIIADVFNDCGIEAENGWMIAIIHHNIDKVHTVADAAKLALPVAKRMGLKTNQQRDIEAAIYAWVGVHGRGQLRTAQRNDRVAASVGLR